MTKRQHDFIAGLIGVLIVMGLLGVPAIFSALDVLSMPTRVTP